MASFDLVLANSLDEVQNGLPSGFNKDRFVHNAVALVKGNDTIMDFMKKNPDGALQVKEGMMRAAFLGLDALNSECYLVPYGKNLQFTIGYKGNVKLAKKYSIRPVRDIYAKVVREGDEFEESIIDGQPSISFKPLPFNNKPIIGAFAVCLFEDGGMIYDTMSLEDLENTRKHSKMANGPAWKNFTSQMYCKTVLNRLTKHLEIEFENPNQHNIFQDDMAVADTEEVVANEIEENANEVEFPGDVIDVEVN